MRVLSSNFTTELDRAKCSPVFLMKFKTDTYPIRLWSGGFGTTVFQEEVYFGTGAAISFGQVKESSNLEAVGLSVSLSGLDSSVKSLVIEENIQGREFWLYMSFLKQNENAKQYDLSEEALKQYNNPAELLKEYNLSGQNTLMQDYIVLYYGLMDSSNISINKDTEGNSKPTFNLTVNIEKNLIKLTKAKNLFFSHEKQQKLFPSDSGLRNINSAVTRELFWGKNA